MVIIVKKLYLLVLFLLVGGTVGASSKKGFIIAPRSTYEKLKSKISQEELFSAIGFYRKDPTKESAFQAILVGYINGDEDIREFMEDDLKGFGNVLSVAKAVLAGKYGW
ncbi:hypothetical protein FACS1894152_8160 [Bacilli bacterium]|nr:hypothetical protein FACS1894152_8160 [Bacilli bacterium]